MRAIAIPDELPLPVRVWKSGALGGGGWAFVDIDGTVYARLNWVATQYEWTAGTKSGHARKWEEAKWAAEAAARRL